MSLLLPGALLQACSDDPSCAETATCPPSPTDAGDVRADFESKDVARVDVASSDAAADAPPDVLGDSRADARSDAIPDANVDVRSDASIDARRDVVFDTGVSNDAEPRDAADTASEASIDAALDVAFDRSVDVAVSDGAIDALRPGDAAVDVDAGAPTCTPTSCGSDKLCCQNACVANDANHCYACDKQCTGATPLCSAALKGCACTEESCAPTHQDCEQSSGQCVICKQRPASEADFYVDQAFSGSPTGSRGCPYRTITAALAAANSSTAAQKTIHVAAGTYDAGGGEQFPLQLRSGISLVGAGAAQTIVRGLGAFDHSALGGYLNGSYQATIVMGDPVAVNTVSDLTIDSGTMPASDAYGVFCDRGNTPADILNPVPNNFPPANVTAARVAIGGYYAAVAVTNTTTDGCNFKVTGSDFLRNGTAILAIGCSIDDHARTAALQMGDGSAEGSNTVTTGVDAGGVIVYDCVSPVSILRNTFSESAAGLWLVTSNRPVLRVEDNTFSNLSRWGIHLEHGTTLETLTGNVLTGIGAEGAIMANETTQIKKARRNLIVGNSYGLSIGNYLGSRVMDFGTASDPGLNTFSCNSNGDPNLPASQMFDVELQAIGPGTIWMQGNAWDHVPPTRSDDWSNAANGTDLAINAAPEAVVDTAGATQAGACVYPHIPGPP